jgi:hypothetical protein
MQNEVTQLISLGNSEKALSLLATRFPADTAILLNQLNDAKREYNLNIIDFSEWQRIQTKINMAALELAARPTSPEAPKTKPAHSPRVFISYSWDDKNDAARVKSFLENAGCIVTIDEQDMQAAEPISSFIQDSIKTNHFILSIVSKNSLSSGWVGRESTASFFAEWLADKQFIPVRLDNAFNDPRFFVATLRSIEEKISELDGLIQEIQAMRADSGPLDMDRKKLLDLKAQLPNILTRLKGINTLPIDVESFDSSMQKVLERIQTR